jgi:hypothetical protein
MLEAEAQGFGQTRGSGNRLEYYWGRDNNSSDDNPPPPDNLGKVREGLGKDVPYTETTTNQGFEANLGNLGKGMPNSSLTHQAVDISEEESLLEGGSVPEASLSTPQDSSDVETAGITDLGNKLGNPFPNPSLSSPNENSHEVEESAAEDIARFLADESWCDNKETLAEMRQCWKPGDMNAACKRLTPERHAQIKAWVLELNCENTQGQEIVVGSKVYWDNCPGHWDSWAPFVVEYIHDDGMVKLEIVREDWLIHISELRLAK